MRLCFFTHFDGDRVGERQGWKGGQGTAGCVGWPAQSQPRLTGMSSDLNTDLTLPSDGP